MKKLLTLALALVTLAAFAGFGTAQQKAQKSQPTGVEMKQPATGEKKMKGKVELIDWVNGIVTKMDDSAKTISIKRKDGSIIIMGYQKLTTPPRVGQTVNVQYTEVDGKPTALAVTDEGAPGEKSKTKTK